MAGFFLSVTSKQPSKMTGISSIQPGFITHRAVNSGIGNPRDRKKSVKAIRMYWATKNQPVQVTTAKAHTSH